METLFILVENYAWLAGWLVTCLVPGIACWGVFTRPAHPYDPPWPNPELALFFTLCTGLAIQIVLLIILASSGLLSTVPILATLTGLMIASLVAFKLSPGGWLQFSRSFRLTGIEWLTILPILLLILPWIFRPLGPPIGSDSLTYHLPYARFYLEQGGLAVNETLRFPLHTHSINLLYAAAMIRPGATLTQMMHASMGLLALLGIYGMSRHWHGWVSGVLVVIGVLLFEEFVRSFGYAYVGNGVILFTTAAFLSVALWTEGKQQSFLWFCAFFAGIAMGIKYQGALFTVPLGLMVLWFSRDLKLTVKFTLLTSLFGLFWYVRSWLISGNPIHPFAGELFGYYIWTAKEVAGQMWELKSHGIDRSFLNFLLLPERMFSARDSFNGFTGSGGILVGAFMVSCLLFHWQKPFVKAMQLTCLVYLIFWFWSSQVIRYLLLITPLMSLCTVTVFVDFGSRLKLVQNANRPGNFRMSVFSYANVLLVVSLISLAWFAGQTLALDHEKVPLTKQQQVEYLRRVIPAYDLMVAAATDPRIGAGPVMQFRVPESKYFFPGTVYGDWMGTHTYKRFAHIGPSDHWEIDDSETLHRKVIEEGFRAVAMRKGQNIQFKPQSIESYREHFDIVLETKKGVLMVPIQ